MSLKSDIAELQDDLADGLFSNFMPRSQRHVLSLNLMGEEKAFFVEMLKGLKKRIQDMPKSYETDGQGTGAMVYLHYFRGSVDAWITEKDVGDGTPDTRQLQAFGRITMGYEPELGYISIHDLIANNVELDLYWTPKTLRELA